MTESILGELQTIKEAAEAALAGSEDPLLTDWLGSVVTQAEGYLNQQTPRAAGTQVQFAEAPKPQQPIGAAPSQEAAEGTADAEAANADAGGEEDELEKEEQEHHRRRRK